MQKLKEMEEKRRQEEISDVEKDRQMEYKIESSITSKPVEASVGLTDTIPCQVYDIPFSLIDVLTRHPSTSVLNAKWSTAPCNAIRYVYST